MAYTAGATPRARAASASAAFGWRRAPAAVISVARRCLGAATAAVATAAAGRRARRRTTAGTRPLAHGEHLTGGPQQRNAGDVSERGWQLPRRQRRIGAVDGEHRHPLAQLASLHAPPEPIRSHDKHIVTSELVVADGEQHEAGWRPAKRGGRCRRALAEHVPSPGGRAGLQQARAPQCRSNQPRISHAAAVVLAGDGRRGHGELNASALTTTPAGRNGRRTLHC
jgi:hypothetical protein